jgi:hypothetical protein
LVFFSFSRSTVSSRMYILILIVPLV